MSKDNVAVDQADKAEEVLANLVEEVTKALEAGEPVDWQIYERDYPQHADQLHRLVGALQVVGGLGHSSVNRPHPVAPSRDEHGLVHGVLGDYRIIREIGRGGMGVVYEAEQVSLGRRVALKVLPFASLMDQRQLARFKNEAHAAAQLHHTNIVPVHSVGCERSVHYYAMQYIEGQSLAEVIAQLREISGLNEPAVSDRRSSDRRRPRSRVRDQGLGVAGAESGEPSAARSDRIHAVSSSPDESGHYEHPDLASELASGRFAPPKRSPTAVEPTGPYTPPPLPPLAKGGTKGGSPPYQGGDTGGVAPAVERETPPVAALSTDGSTRSPAYFRSIASLGIQAAEALDHAHTNGVLHRDIKPANLILDTTGNLWVTDFGLARMETDAGMTMTGDLLGTLRYMSPEQALAKRIVVDHRTDIYSLGVTLYELLLLQPAFGGRDRQELLRQIAFDEPRVPRRINKSIPRELETIVLKGISKNPAERYATAQELADDLRRFLEDKPIQASRPTVFERAAKWSRRRRPVVASVGASAAIGLVAVAVVSTILLARERTARLEANQQLVQLHVAHGVRFLNEGDLLGSVPWFAEALRLDQGDPSREQMHRIRLATLLRQCPKLVQVWYHEDTVRDAEFSAEGRRIVTAYAEFSPNGQWVVTTSSGPTARVWDVVTGAVIATLKHSSRVNYASFSPDGRYVVTASGNPSGWTVQAVQIAYRGKGEARVWNAVTGQPVTRALPHGGRVVIASFSPDSNYVVTASDDKTARVWDAVTGLPVTPPLKHEGPVYHASFSPNGRQVVTGSQDNVARVWDAVTGQPISPPLWHPRWVNHASFSPDGRYVVTASQDKTARVWDVVSGQPITAPLKHGGAVSHAEFSRDGQRVLTASSGGTARVWNLTPDDRPVDDLLLHAQLLAGYRIDDTSGFVALDVDTLRSHWQTLRTKYPDKFVASSEEIFDWHRREAEYCVGNQRWSDAVRHLDVVILEAEPARWMDLLARGRAHAELGQWDKAAGDYSKAARLGGDNSVYRRHAEALLVAGDLDGYRRACATLLEHFGHTESALIARYVAWTCALAPNALADMSQPVELARMAMNSREGGAELRILGATLYRAGQPREAVQRLNRAIAVGNSRAPWGAYTAFFLAMTYHQLDDANESRRWLDKAVEWTELHAQQRSSTARHRLLLQRLCQEAESLLESGMRDEG